MARKEPEFKQSQKVSGEHSQSQMSELFERLSQKIRRAKARAPVAVQDANRILSNDAMLRATLAYLTEQGTPQDRLNEFKSWANVYVHDSHNGPFVELYLGPLQRLVIEDLGADKLTVNGAVASLIGRKSFRKFTPDDIGILLGIAAAPAKVEGAHADSTIVELAKHVAPVPKRRRRSKKNQPKQWHLRAKSYLHQTNGEISDSEIARLCEVDQSVVSRDKVFQALRKSYVVKKPVKQIPEKL